MTRSTVWFFGLLGLVAVLVFALGFLGWLIHPLRSCGPLDWGSFAATVDVVGGCLKAAVASNPPSLVWPDHYLQAAIHTVMLFYAELPPGETVAADEYLLQVARFLAPLIAPSAAIRIVFEIFTAQWERWRISRMRRHMVICGATESGLAFARNGARIGWKGVIVDAAVSDAMANTIAGHGFRVLRGDPLDREILQAAGVARANRLIVVTGDDNRNLEITMVARSIAQARRPAHLRALRANVAIDDRLLWRRLRRSPAIDRGSDRFDMLPFNFALWAARDLTWRVPLPAYADLRNQRGVHVVVFGVTAYSEALLGQMPPAYVYRDFPPIRLTVLTDGSIEADAQRLLSLFPALADPEIADFTVRQFRPEQERLDADLMDDIARGSTDRPEVTAVIICYDAATKTLSAAAMVSEAMRRTRRWRCPIYARLAQCHGVEDMLKSSHKARRFDSVIEPFGVEDKLCDVGFLEGWIEEQAEAIHVAYRTNREQEAAIAGRSNPNFPLTEWLSLPETYRVSNRRALDHIQAKLLSVGARTPASPTLAAASTFKLVPESNGAAVLDALAALEHQSWLVGRRLDGWEYGSVRDNDRQIHDNLIPYADLDEPTRQIDRNQILFVDAHVLQRSDSRYLSKQADYVRNNITIGLLGGPALDGEHDIDQLVNNSYPRRLLEIVTSDPTIFVTIICNILSEREVLMLNIVCYLFDQNKVEYRIILISRNYDCGWKDSINPKKLDHQLINGKELCSQFPRLHDSIDWIVDENTISKEDTMVDILAPKLPEYFARVSDVLCIYEDGSDRINCSSAFVNATLAARKSLTESDPSNPWYSKHQGEPIVIDAGLVRTPVSSAARG